MERLGANGKSVGGKAPKRWYVEEYRADGVEGPLKVILPDRIIWDLEL